MKKGAFVMDLEQLGFFKVPKSNSVKTTVGISLPVELKKDILTVAEHYEISANTVVAECLRLALLAEHKQNINFSPLLDVEKSASETLVLHLKKTTVSAIRQLAKENNTSISSVVRKCIVYVLNYQWETERQKSINFEKLGSKIYHLAEEYGIHHNFKPKFIKDVLAYLTPAFTKAQQNLQKSK